MKNGKRIAAVVLAAGSGKRMGTNTPKQFLEVNEKPLLYYCTKKFNDSFIDEIIIVCRPDDKEYISKEIVKKFSLGKVTKIVCGGKERYHSVAAGLEAIDFCDYVLIHDGARPFVTDEIIDSAYETVSENGSAITAVPSKDTVKIVDENGFITATPNRNTVYLMQTPQTFDFLSIRNCYRQLLSQEDEIIASGVTITDDAMVMEKFGSGKVKLSSGDYRNIKITTPEDMILAKAYMEDLKLC